MLEIFSPMINSLFIADLHLTEYSNKKNALFERFCEQCIAYDNLFILGDLFNVWLGDDISLKNHKRLVSVLKKLSKHTQIFILAGNRDFLLGTHFEKKSGCKLIREPYLVSIFNNRYLLMHGDSLCTDDINYQLAKKFLRNRIMQFIFLHLPRSFRIAIAFKIRQKSKIAKRIKPSKITDVNLNTVDNLMRRYPNTTLIHGHTHRKNIHTRKYYKRIVLGDWQNDKASALKIDENITWFNIK